MQLEEPEPPTEMDIETPAKADEIEIPAKADDAPQNTPTINQIRKEVMEKANQQLYVYKYHEKKFFPTSKGVQIETQYERSAKPYLTYHAQEAGDEDSIHEALKTNLPTILAAYFPELSGITNQASETQIAQVVRGLDNPHSTPAGNIDKETVWQAKSKFRRTAYRLRCTSPEAFQHFWKPETGFLSKTFATMVWTQINAYYGSKWTLQNPPPTPTKNKPKKTPPKVTFDQTATPAKSGFYPVSQEMKNQEDPQTFVPLKQQRKHTTYFKAVLPQVSGETTIEIQKETHQAFLEMIDILASVDKTIVLHPFPEPYAYSAEKSTAQCIPNQAIKTTIKHYKKIQPYVDRIWPKSGQWTYLRVYIGHNQPLEAFQTDAWKEKIGQSEFRITVHPIQSAKIVNAGWLFGSYPATFDTIQFERTMRIHTLMKGLDIAVVKRNIKASPNEDMSRKGKNQVQAIHIDCGREHRGAVDKALKKIFNQRSPGWQSLLPEGRDMKFMPSTSEPGTSVSRPVKEEQARYARWKQAAFIASQQQATIGFCTDPDYGVLLEGNVITIRQILMCMTSARDRNIPMFTCVDRTWNGDVVAVFSKDRANEAKQFLAHLPLYLEQRYGPQAWTFFTHEAPIYMDEYVFRDGKVVEKTEDQFDFTIRGETIPDNDDDSTSDILGGVERMGFYENLDDVDIPNTETEFQFDLGIQINLDFVPDTLPQYDANRSITTAKSGISQNTAALQEAFEQSMQQANQPPPEVSVDSNSISSSLTDKSRKSNAVPAINRGGETN